MGNQLIIKGGQLRSTPIQHALKLSKGAMYKAVVTMQNNRMWNAEKSIINNLLLRALKMLQFRASLLDRVGPTPFHDQQVSEIKQYDRYKKKIIGTSKSNI